MHVVVSDMQVCLCRRGWQFTPTFEILDWAIFSSPMRFVQALTLVAMTLAFELNAFFLKTLLWLPPPHFLNISRLLFLWSLALPAVKEYHEFLEVCMQPLRLSLLFGQSTA